MIHGKGLESLWIPKVELLQSMHQEMMNEGRSENGRLRIQCWQNLQVEAQNGTVLVFKTQGMAPM